MKGKFPKKTPWLQRKLPFHRVLLWITLSIPLISGPAVMIQRTCRRMQAERERSPKFYISRIIQTGPEREALPTRQLCEWLDLSEDCPVSLYQIDVRAAEEKLLDVPIIREATVTVKSPDALYIDYALRRPIARVADYEDIAIDDEGVIFPLKPFFTPKKLPEIYFGLAPFGLPPDTSEKPIGIWHTPLRSAALDLAFGVMHLLEHDEYKVHFDLKRIDVSNAFLDSYGRREVVLFTEDHIRWSDGSEAVMPRILRLSPRDIAQQLANYVNLRERLIESERQKPLRGRAKEKIIDFRVPHLAYIDDREENG